MTENSSIVPQAHHSLAGLAAVGRAANQAAGRIVFAEYREGKATNTLRQQDATLALFADFLASVGAAPGGDLSTTPEGWRGVTWGLVTAFKHWLKQQGYAIGTINVRLSTIKTYASLAFKAGALTEAEHSAIQGVTGYGYTEGQRVDERRDVTRVGDKKAAPVRLSAHDAAALKDQPDTPQGRRDALLMCLLLDHGLRCGEVAALMVDNLDLQAGRMTFYREKVGKTQTHRLTPDTLRAARAWAASGDMPTPGKPLLRKSRKGGALGTPGMSKRAITKRVEVLGAALGIDGLSAHDCRHYWATHAAAAGTDPFILQEAGGWSSLAMPRRYVEDAKIANEGIRGFGLEGEAHP